MLQNAYLTTHNIVNAVKLGKGEPQGGILSPILFDYYIDDLAIKLDRQFKTFYFADDLAFICIGKKQLKKAIDLVQ